jgi:hypothetical protein
MYIGASNKRPLFIRNAFLGKVLAMGFGGERMDKKGKMWKT